MTVDLTGAGFKKDRCKVRTFEVGEKALWWDGYFVFDVSINKVGEYACRVVSDETKISHEALICDLYRKTSQDLERLKSRIHDLRYRLTNLMEELDLMIEEAEGK